MAFNADAFREAHRPWAFTLQGRTYSARHVSAPQVQAYERRAAAAKTEAQHRRALRILLRRAFPWRVSYLLRGDPVDLVIRLEPAARREALTDFFACLAGKSPDPRQKTDGTNSPDSTPIPAP